ncbi:MAG: oxidoreductase [Subtercola sp.]|nr:oxidoreductase [Subtercola sp.]
MLVTGGGSGIGRAIARAFLEQGARVALSGSHADALRETVAEFPADSTLVLEGDMAVRSDVEATVAAVAAAWGGIDVVIANAGLSEAGTIDELTDES